MALQILKKKGDMEVPICHSMLLVHFFSVSVKLLISLLIFNDFPLVYEFILVVIYDMVAVCVRVRDIQNWYAPAMHTYMKCTQ